MNKQGGISMKYKKENKKPQTDITYFYIDPKEKILLKKPDLKKGIC